MRMRLLTAIALTAITSLFATSQAGAAGFKDFDVAYVKSDGSPVTQAGSRPYEMTTSLDFTTTIDPDSGKVVLEDDFKDLIVKLAPGQVGDPEAVPTCPAADLFSTEKEGEFIEGEIHSACKDSTAVGVVKVRGPGLIGGEPRAVYNMVPPPGTVAKLGFVEVIPITMVIRINPEPPHNLVVSLVNVDNLIPIGGSDFTVWGNPASPVHDSERGQCAGAGRPGKTCPVDIPERLFVTMPRSCEGPLPTSARADFWDEPGAFLPSGEPDPLDPAWAPASALTHDDAEPPSPLGTTGCGRLGFSPSISAQPTTKAGSSPTGLDFSLDVNDEGLTNPDGLPQSDIKKTVVTLPEGFSVNPSIADGLEVCTPEQLDRETAFSEGGAGCPNASKIGSVEVESQLLDEKVNGSLYQAAPYDNPFDSLIALYIVIKNPTLGIIVKQPLNVIPDQVTGRLTTVAEDMPQLPFSHFNLHFREGARSPLASPSKCGTYSAEADLYPWSGGAPVHTTSAFQIITGPGGGPCPSGGLPPFKPGLIAGSINNAAGRFSPFNVRLFRTDSEQEITHFSIKLPPGITAKLAGVPYCSDAQIAAAKARTGPFGGAEELANPSCPAASEIGRSLVGGGVGAALAYAPGKIYLAGPYNGSNLSIAAITAGIVGPFDIGTVVVREALKIDPETAEAFIDATGSDPIPHIIKGVPVHLRDVRAYVDRPSFMLNPTDCKRTSTASTVLGSGLDFGSEADDRPVTVSTPYQAADCAALPFKPRLSLRLRGGTKRGAHPALTARLKMNGIGEAGIARAEVTLPKSEFIENAHFQTICTRQQFKAGAGNGAECPAGSVYGRATAVTPILGEPLTGPIFLRSSEHQLPDVVAAMHNAQVDFALVGRVDSVKGRLRSTFETTPDAPVTSAVFSFLGGKKGLFVNSTNLCKGTHRAEVNFDGQNGKVWDKKPALQVKCKGKRHKGKGSKRRAG